MILHTGVSENKYSVADYQYFKNGIGKTHQCSIFRYINTTFIYLFVNFQLHNVKGNKSYGVEKNDGSNGTKSIK